MSLSRMVCFQSLRTVHVLGALVIGLGAAGSVRAQTLTVAAIDPSGAPAENVVVTARPLFDAGQIAQTVGPTPIMDQRNRRFVPRVLPVRLGTTVSFPNSDDTRHHVYSFSSAKSFELPLYHGTTSEPVVFDRPGVAVLGCNIHDSMVGYVYVTDAPRFDAADATGRSRLEGLRPGPWEVSVWHPGLAAGEPIRRRVEVSAEGARLDVEIDSSPQPPSRTPESPLASKFKRFRGDSE